MLSKHHTVSLILLFSAVVASRWRTDWAFGALVWGYKGDPSRRRDCHLMTPPFYPY